LIFKTEDFYKTLIRKKLSHFLLEEERRDTGKAKRHRIQQQQSTKISTPTILCPTSMPTINPSVSPTNDE
jgi:hypothetical protein